MSKRDVSAYAISSVLEKTEESLKIPTTLKWPWVEKFNAKPEFSDRNNNNDCWQKLSNKAPHVFR